MITHPKGAVLEALAQAGIAPSQLHAVADEIAAAYAEANHDATALEIEAEVTATFGQGMNGREARP